ncbi:MAG TPA: MaoC/PaaZ C-terminal domain-containing protein [Azospirillaceae bacterium]|nr:MaoC/PaaZ C-terminal domain-containing protein [Azospirillaceae bacterium]
MQSLDTAQGLEVREHLEFRVTRDQMRAFAALSGDDNPIHDDADYARARGFEGPIVYGGLILAQVSRLLGTRLPGHGCVWHSLSMQFRTPLYVDEAAELHARVTHANEALGLVRLMLEVRAGGRRIASGEAQALRAGAGG